MEYDVFVDNINRKEWEQYAGYFADYNIYQTWPYQQIRAESDSQKISRVVIKDERGRVIMMAQVRIKSIKLLKYKIGYVQWGPLARAFDGTLKCSGQAFSAFRKAYVGTKVNVLRVIPSICDDETGKHLLQMLISGGFQRVNSIAPYRTLMLCVDDSEEEIRRRLRKSFRRDVKKAEKCGIEIRQGHQQEFCDVLRELYSDSLRRKVFKGLDPQEFIDSQLLLSPAEKMNIIVAYYDGEPVSVHLASNLGDTAVVLLAASNTKGLACGSSYLIWYQAAISALRAGMKIYDLGGIDPENNPNVTQFKSRMGGDETSYIGAFEACSSTHARIIWRILEKAYGLIKK